MSSRAAGATQRNPISRKGRGRGRQGKARQGKRKGKRKGKEKGKERKGKERKGKERKGKERKGKERKGKERGPGSDVGGNWHGRTTEGQEFVADVYKWETGNWGYPLENPRCQELKRSPEHNSDDISQNTQQKGDRICTEYIQWVEMASG
jgi:hypothetical protein